MPDSESAIAENASSPQARAGTPPKGSTMLKPVFLPASVVIIGIIALVIVFRAQAESAAVHLNTWISEGVGWWYVIAVNLYLLFALYFAFSRIGKIRLGRDGEEPEFGVVTWFMMLFSAGMGIGLVFFGVAEPLFNYMTPAQAFGAAPETDQAARQSVGVMMLQWGLHPWAIYSIVGLGLAYMTFRRGRPLAVRWLLEPLIGRQRVEGWMGHVIDVVAIVGTLFGVATSFGFGVSQIIAGLEYLGWATSNNWLIIILIMVITGVAIYSVVSGVHRGLKWLSNINMTLAAILAVLVLALGPTLLLIKGIPENLGSYLSMLPQTMLNTGTWSTDGWEIAWTIAYWGWWTSWAPFVGVFIARISRGRTVRQFIIGVLVAPTLVSLVWFTVFGDSGIFYQRQNGSLTDDEGKINSTTALFQMLGNLPLTTILSVIAIIVVVFFFVTSSDSGSLVIDMLANGGSTETPVVTRVYWSVLEGLAAAVLLVVGGSQALKALQTLAIATALPFSIILVLACFALWRAFRYEVSVMPEYLQISAPSGSGLPTGPIPVVATPDGPGAADGGLAEGPLRGIGYVASTYAGLPPATTDTPANGGTSILTIRNLDSGDLTYDAHTGEPTGVGAVADPLGGQVFDTEEFVTSQEYINQGGTYVPVPHDGDAPG